MQPYSFQSIATVALTLAAIAACRHPQQPGPRVAGSPDPTIAVVEEVWISTYDEADNVDSLAVAADEGLVIATCKSTHQLLLLDAATGEIMKRIGGPGEALGEFARPNGIAVVDDLVLVVERDNHRVQVLKLPSFEPLGIIGEDLLERPYGIAAHRSPDGGVEMWITDNFDPPSLDNHRLNERIRHFLAQLRDGRLHWDLVNTFGERRGSGALLKVETIGFDPTRRLLIVAEETFERMGLVVYTADGAFTGTVVGNGVFEAEPEGIAWWQREQASYWIATDQPSTHSIFHLFHQGDFTSAGAFRGRVTANTDGVAIANQAITGFPDGAFFAVHDDGAVAAFDLAAIAETVGLRSTVQPHGGN
jgi:3-phytase